MRRIASQRGDTLIEVMLVLALMSIVVLSVFGMMSRGNANLQLSLERSLVRAELDGQVNAIRAMRDAYMANPTSYPLGLAWNDILTTRLIAGEPVFNDTSCDASDPKAFYVNISESPAGIALASYTNPVPATYAKPGDGIWLELYERKGTATTIGAVDVLARACWGAIGEDSLQFETSVVRLYDGKL